MDPVPYDQAVIAGRLILICIMVVLVVILAPYVPTSKRRKKGPWDRK